MKNNLKKKAFTLVELLIVIAILAILSTVSIIGYGSFTKKANLSNDQTEITQMNRLIKAATVGEKEVTAFNAYKALTDNGFDFATVTPNSENCKYGFSIDDKDVGLYDVEQKKLVYSPSHTDDGDMNNVVFFEEDQLLYSGNYTHDLSFSDEIRNNIKIETDSEIELLFDGIIIGNVTIDAPNATVKQEKGIITGDGYGSSKQDDDNYVFNKGNLVIDKAKDVLISGYVDRAQFKNTNVTIEEKGVIRDIVSSNSSTINNNGWISYTTATISANNGVYKGTKASSYTIPLVYDIYSVEDFLKVAAKTQNSGLSYFSTISAKAKNQLVLNLKNDIDLTNVLYIPMASYNNYNNGSGPSKQLSIIINGNNFEISGLRQNFIGAIGAGTKIDNLRLNFNYKATPTTDPREELLYRNANQDGNISAAFIFANDSSSAIAYNTIDGESTYLGSGKYFMHVGCLANAVVNSTSEPIEINNLCVSGKLVFDNIQKASGYCLAIIAGEANGGDSSNICFAVKDLYVDKNFELDAICYSGVHMYHNSATAAALYYGDFGSSTKIKIIYTNNTEINQLCKKSLIYSDFYTTILGKGSIIVSE